MLYAAIAIIVAGIMAALAPIVREWSEHRKRKDEEKKEKQEKEKRGRH
ncbi:hypothetical protein [Pseudoduganella umbonata]|uniref:Uncharacterized protein n=1 Tax=Pseudoduganella umbonata TaxID=864828 RepID=A0A7W5ECU9_9BURK|nr:hypothetical protein [Pseudoduganella umbonata]MBB3222271.1 hypothetical protein [Pseudoduganella umbonata]